MTSKSYPSELSIAAPGIRSTGVHLGLVPLPSLDIFCFIPLNICGYVSISLENRKKIVFGLTSFPAILSHAENFRFGSMCL